MKNAIFFKFLPSTSMSLILVTIAIILQLTGCVSGWHDVATFLGSGDQMIEPQGLHIIFPAESRVSVGVVPIIRDKERMEAQTYVQAAMFATKLKKNYSIYRLANIDWEHSGEYAVFIVNTIEDMNIRDFYMASLQQVHHIDFAGHNIVFYDIKEKTRPLNIINFYEDLKPLSSQTKIDGHFVKATAFASSSRLDEALDKAFELALAEISRFQIKNVMSMTKDAEGFYEVTTVTEAENVVNNVMFSEIKLQLNFSINLASYVVSVELKKDLREETIDDMIPSVPLNTRERESKVRVRGGGRRERAAPTTVDHEIQSQTNPDIHLKKSGIEAKIQADMPSYPGDSKAENTKPSQVSPIVPVPTKDENTKEDDNI